MVGQIKKIFGIGENRFGKKKKIRWTPETKNEQSSSVADVAAVVAAAAVVAVPVADGVAAAAIST